MILSGEKKEEYREIKSYWVKRLIDTMYAEVNYDMDSVCFFLRTNDVESNIEIVFKAFDIIRFTNGYGKNAPTLDIQCKGIKIGKGKKEWGGIGAEVFIISLGKIISSNYLTTTLKKEQFAYQ